MFRISILAAFLPISLAFGDPKGPLASFGSPDATYRPKFRYWQAISTSLPDANSDIDAIVSDVQALSQVGGGGILLCPFYNFGFASIPTELPYSTWDEKAFGSEAFRDVFYAALDASRQNDVTFDFQIGASQGQGVPSPPLTSGLAVHLVYGQTLLPGGDTFQGQLPEDDPEDLNLNASSIAQFMHPHEDFGPRKLVGVVLAGIVPSNTSTSKAGDGHSTMFIDESSLVDLTENVVNGQLTWEVPEEHDTYILFAFYERYTNQRSCDGLPNATSLIANGSWVTDHFSSAGANLVTEFWEDNILDDKMKMLLGDVGEHTFEDSMEMNAALYWSEGFIERFESINGYRPIKYLPLLFNMVHSYRMESPPYNTTYVLYGDENPSENMYLQDYRKALGHGYDEYLATYESWAQNLGMSHSAQAGYHLPLDMSGSAATIGGPELESLAFPEIDHALQFVGGVHISGPNLISSEVGAIFPSYSLRVSDLVHLFKIGYAAGVNVMVIHGMTYSGEYYSSTWPGYTTFQYLSGEQWSPRVPGWKYLDDSLEWAARVQLALQSGTAKKDVAFYLYKEPWTATVEYEGSDLRNSGFSYEYLGPSSLAAAEAVAENSFLVPDGPAYKALVFDNQTFISEEAAHKVLEFAHSGLPIFIKGSTPKRSIGTLGREAVSAAMGALEHFDNVRFLKDSESLSDALKAASILPRFSVSPDTPAADLWSVWRQADSEDLVYLYNGNQTQEFNLTFTVAEDSTPYWLDAWTGEQHPLRVYQRTKSGISLSLTLATDQATIISFSRSCSPEETSVTSHSSNIVKIYASQNYSTVALMDDADAATLTLSSGRQIEVPALRDNTTFVDIVLGDWNLTLESWVPSNDSSVTRSMIETIDIGPLDTLQPWFTIEGVETASGVGIYTNILTTPAGFSTERLAVLIHFGPVLDTLRAWINDKPLPAIDNSNAEVEISEFLVPGANEIRVEISSTLFNAVKLRAGSLVSGGLPIMDPKPYDLANVQEHGLLGPIAFKVLRKELLRL